MRGERKTGVRFWSGLDRVVVILCITEVVSWGSLYYSLPAAVGAISAETGWSIVTITGCFSAGLVVSALVGVPVGRLLDRWGPRTVMTAGSMLAVAGLVALANATTVAGFLAAWLLIGVSQAAVLYQPAFTVIARHYGAGRDRPLLILTLAGGLASTIYVPSILGLLAVFDWRTTYLMLAGVLAVTTVPLHLLLPATGERRARRSTPERALQEPVVRSRQFVLLSAGMTVMTFGAYAVTLNLLPLVAERGYSPAVAATAFALVGVGQVAGRIGLTVLTRTVPPRHRPFAVGTLVAVTLMLFAIVPGPAWLLAAVALLSGAARGALTLVQATAVPARWGDARLGELNGVFSAPITAATALAPVAGATLATGVASYPGAAAVFAGVALLGAACALLADRRVLGVRKPLRAEAERGQS